MRTQHGPAIVRVRGALALGVAMWVWIGAPSWADDTAPADRVNELVAALGEVNARALPADVRAAARGTGSKHHAAAP